MESTPHCPECGADWTGGKSCQDHFHQLLFWEAEDPARGVVHHLMVLCYHLQHPSLYSPEGLRHALGLLDDFVERGLSPAEVRQRQRERVASDRRTWKVTARPGSQGAYAQPPAWRMTAADVVVAGPENYVAQVRAWARSVYESMREEKPDADER
jgi:hypothetical protein